MLAGCGGHGGRFGFMKRTELDLGGEKALHPVAQRRVAGTIFVQEGRPLLGGQLFNGFEKNGFRLVGCVKRRPA